MDADQAWNRRGRLHGHRGPARLQGGAALYACRPVPHRSQREYELLRDALENPAQRCCSRTTSPRCRRHWLCLAVLGLPQLAGASVGAPGARIRSGIHHHRSQRGVPWCAAMVENIMVENPFPKMPEQARRGNPRAHCHGASLHAAGLWVP